MVTAGRKYRFCTSDIPMSEVENVYISVEFLIVFTLKSLVLTVMVNVHRLCTLNSLHRFRVHCG